MKKKMEKENIIISRTFKLYVFEGFESFNHLLYINIYYITKNHPNGYCSITIDLFLDVGVHQKKVFSDVYIIQMIY